MVDLPDDVLTKAGHAFLRAWQLCNQGDQTSRILGTQALIRALEDAGYDISRWEDISTAPRDGTEVWGYAPPAHGLEPLQGWCAYHPDAGWCIDELRDITHWRPLPPPPKDADHG